MRLHYQWIKLKKLGKTFETNFVKHFYSPRWKQIAIVTWSTLKRSATRSLWKLRAQCSSISSKRSVRTTARSSANYKQPWWLMITPSSGRNFWAGRLTHSIWQDSPRTHWLLLKSIQTTNQPWRSISKTMLLGKYRLSQWLFTLVMESSFCKKTKSHYHCTHRTVLRARCTNKKYKLRSHQWPKRTWWVWARTLTIFTLS